jgi:protein-tyrosine phosphatase
MTMMTPDPSGPGPQDAGDIPPFRQGARVTRDKASKEAYLELRSDGPWRLFVSRSPDAFDDSRPLLTGEGPGRFPLPVEPLAREYFLLRRGDASLVLADELLPMAGGYNFRDLGGIPAAGGRFTAWGKLFRSDGMHHLEPDDLRYLASLPLVTVVDFRTTDSLERSPDRVPETVTNLVSLPLSPGSLTPADRDVSLTADTWVDFMRNINRELVLEEEYAQVFRRFFAILAQEDNLPALFHCAAGKDRTGLAAAYILFSLGVSEDVVMRNYLASGVYLRGKYDHLLEKMPERAPLFTVRSEYLQSAIDAMREKSGSVEAYLADVLKVDLDAMRRSFLS